MKIIVTHSSDFEFKKKLYQPLRKSSLNKKYDIFLPQEKGKEQMTNDFIKSCDVVIAEVSMPSTGQGIELGWANIFDIPIICIQESGSKSSSSLSFITDTFIKYNNTTDMLDKLDKALESCSK